MSLRDHLRELRRRIFFAGIGIALGSVAGFFLYDWVVATLGAPVLQYEGEAGRLTDLAFNTVGQPLDMLIRISFFVGVVISSPVWLYQVWAFIMPGLKKKEKWYAIGFIAASTPLFLAGIWLAYTLLPRAIEFLLSLNPEGISNIIAPDIYFTFVLHLFLACGIAMVIPVILVGLNMLGLISGKQILNSWRGVIMSIAVISAFAAPEVVSMFFVMLPLTLLFGLAIALCLINDKRKAKREVFEAQGGADGGLPAHQ